jgi:hypothetical protein
MQAIKIREYGEPSVLKVEEVPVPQPGAQQVLVKVHSVGVNPYEVCWRALIYVERVLLLGISVSVFKSVCVFVWYSMFVHVAPAKCVWGYQCLCVYVCVFVCVCVDITAALHS